jgi:hypothetical protein
MTTSEIRLSPGTGSWREQIHRLEGETGMTVIDVASREPRTCVSEPVWERLVRLIMRDHGLDRELAERTADQTVAYLVTSAENPRAAMGPPPAVDKGVHTFVLDSPNYIAFCDQHAGRYIHHVPHLSEDGDSEVGVVKRTISAVRAAGFPVDSELWDAPGADCNQCYSGCSDSPKK